MINHLSMIKTGKEEISYLIDKVIEKYEAETRETVLRNTNRKNYEALAIKLSAISNNLPFTAEELDHEEYPADKSIRKQKYPYRKYDITSSQIKDACYKIISRPKPFLIDACYIYLFGMGRKGFEKDVKDINLLNSPDEFLQESDILDNPAELNKIYLNTKNENEKLKQSTKKLRVTFTAGLTLSLLICVFLIFKSNDLLSENEKWEVVKKDMSLFAYQPTEAEIDSLQGVWLGYSSSPQARITDPDRYHMVGKSIIDVEYKDGYFTFVRYGPNFNQIGYMKYESPQVVSMYAHIENESGAIISPKYSLMKLESGNPILNVISASWSFDSGDMNRLMGIREVFMKQGKGKVDAVFNSVDNATCRCKIINWEQDNELVKTFYLKNEFVDTIRNGTLTKLLDEKSFIPAVPLPDSFIKKDTLISPDDLVHLGI